MTATLAGTPLQERNGADPAPIPHAHTQYPTAPVPLATATAAATATATAAATAAVSPRRGVDVDTLESSLCCALCSQLLLDAVVTPCGHGFCLACLEKHIQCGDDCCPCCEDRAPVLQRKDYKDIVYHRSSHLDNLVWLLLESADGSLKDCFARRELADRAYMQVTRILHTMLFRHRQIPSASHCPLAPLLHHSLLIDNRPRLNRES
jgi:hypothetical protein